MLLEELQEIVKVGECDRIEFKATTGQRTEAAKAVCALLNGIGGYVIFGVLDNGGIKGQEVTAKTIEEIVREFHRIDPPAFPEIKTVDVGAGRFAVVIQVSGKCGTYTYDGRPYIRYGPTTQTMPKEEYDRRVLEKLHGERRWENEAVPDWVSVTDLDENEIQIALQNAVRLGRISQPKHTDTESVLRGMSLIDNDRLIRAAIALFGKNERLASSFPQLSIRLARFRGESRLTGFMDNRSYWGNAFDLLRRGELFLMDHVPISGRVVSGKMIREDYPLYPPFATREALANAICHRDYTMPGGAVAVAMHNDRLEIISPGPFHFDITPEKLLQPHESKPWNPIIAEVLYRTGVIERWGTGTLNIAEWCKANGNPPPSWKVRTQSVVALFFPSLFYATGMTVDELEKQETDSRLETGLGLRLETGLESKLGEAVLALLKEKALSRAEIAKGLGHKTISSGLNKVIRNLLDAGRIAYTVPEVPNSRKQKYKLS